MRTFASIAFAYLLAAAILWSAYGLFERASRRLGADDRLAPLAALLGVSLIGYVAFFVYRLSPKFGLVCSIAASLALLVLLIHRLRLRRDPGGDLFLALSALFGLLYLACAFLFVTERVPGVINYLFFESERAGDNAAAMIYANAIYKGLDTVRPNGDWYFSDRPPLQTGFDLFFTPLRALFGNDDAHQAVGTLLQVFVLAMIGYLAMALRLRRDLALLAQLTIGGTGFVFYNSIYVWPKLQAGAFIILALVPIAAAFLAQRRLSVAEAPVVAGGVAMAMLSHGAAAFSVLALAILLAIMVLRFFTLRTFVLAGATAAVLYAPWAAFTHFVEPNQGRLLKMHLAGGDDMSAEPFFSMFVRSYREITLERWIDNRIENLGLTFGARDVDRLIADVASHMIDANRPYTPERRIAGAIYNGNNLKDDVRSLASMLRVDQREFMFRSFGLLNLAWPLLLLAIWPQWRHRLFDRATTGLIVLNTLTLVVWVIAQFKPAMTINTHASYALLMTFMLLAIILLDRVSPALARAVCYANIALTAVIWVAAMPGPFLRAQSGLNWLALGACCAALAAIVVAVRRDRDPAST